MAKWEGAEASKRQGTVREQQERAAEKIEEKEMSWLKLLAYLIIRNARRRQPLRGHDESCSSLNKGHFLEDLDTACLLSADVSAVRESLSKNATYTSHDCQNDMIECAASIVVADIVRLVHKVKWFAIIVDETRDVGKTEQLSFVIRFFNLEKVCIEERFLGFFDIVDLRAESIFNLIKDLLVKFDLSLANCVAQAYDGASTMSGELSGVQTRVRQVVPFCVFVKCYAHRLNRALVATTKDIALCNEVLGCIQNIHNFFSQSVPRHEAFKQTQLDAGASVLEVPGLCETR